MEHETLDLETIIEGPLEPNPEEECVFEDQYGIEIEEQYRSDLERQEIENAIDEHREALPEDHYDVGQELLEVHEAVKKVQDSAEKQEPEITIWIVDNQGGF